MEKIQISRSMPSSVLSMKWLLEDFISTGLGVNAHSNHWLEVFFLFNLD
jgi:hypothetical protein